MKPIILLLFVCCVAVKGAPDQNIEEVVGGYNFTFRTADQARIEEGKLVKNTDNKIVLRITGAYSFIDAERKLVLLEYTADENGSNQSKRILDEGNLRLDDKVIHSLIGGGTKKNQKKDNNHKKHHNKNNNKNKIGC